MSNSNEPSPRRASGAGGSSPEGSTRDRRFTVRKLGHAQHRVSLSGALKPRFMALLSTRLSDRRISIQRAHARRGIDGRWQAELDLMRLEGGVDPATLDYAELADTEGFLQKGVLMLDRFTLHEDPRHGGSMRLEVEAPDSLGFLARLLSLLSMLVLFPAELTIETVDGSVRDTLLLVSTGGLTPGPDAYTMLRGMLEKARRA